MLHDVTLPGWLDSLEHLVVGPTGVWVVGSWHHRGRQARRNTGASGAPATTLRAKVEAIADLLEGGVRVPVQGLLCLQRSWVPCPRSVQGVRMATPRQLTQAVRSGSPVAPDEVEWVSGRLLEALRPAA